MLLTQNTAPQIKHLILLCITTILGGKLLHVLALGQSVGAVLLLPVLLSVAIRGTVCLPCTSGGWARAKEAMAAMVLLVLGVPALLLHVVVWRGVVLGHAALTRTMPMFTVGLVGSCCSELLLIRGAWYVVHYQ